MKNILGAIKISTWNANLAYLVKIEANRWVNRIKTGRKNQKNPRIAPYKGERGREKTKRKVEKKLEEIGYPNRLRRRRR